MKKSVITRSLAAGASALFLNVTIASAMVIDFEDGNPFATTNAGAISTDHSVSGASSLYLPAGSLASYQIPAEYLGQDIVVSMKVLDLGRWIDSTVTGAPVTTYGPRWGVGNGTATTANGTQFIVANYQQRVIDVEGVPTLVSDSTKYGVSNGTVSGSSITSSIFDDNIEYADRALLADGGSNPTESAWIAPVADPDGVWTDWTFEITSLGEVTVTLDGEDSVTYALANPITYIYMHGGRTGGLSSMSGAYFDDISITVVPEPETVGLVLGGFALAGVFVLRRRRV